MWSTVFAHTLWISSLLLQIEADPPLGVFPGNSSSVWTDLESVDTAFNTPFAASFEVNYSLRPTGFDEGRHRAVIRLTRDGKSTAISAMYEYAALPPYHHPGESGYEDIDFDQRKNLHVWRQNSREVIDTSANCVEFVEQEHLVISPTGNLVEKWNLESAQEHEDSRDALSHEFAFVPLALGIGLSHGAKVESLKTLDSGTVEIGVASVWSNAAGNWKLLLADVGGASLVRIAEFRYQDNDASILRVTTTGKLMRGKLTLPEYGTLGYAMADTDLFHST